MKRGTKSIIVLIAAMIITAIAVSTAAAAVIDDEQLSLNWESEPVEYKHFTDLGHYVLKLDDADYSKFEEEILPILVEMNDPFQSGCTASVKRNSKDEVIIGRNMDIEISQGPAYITRIKGGKYDTVAFSYMGGVGKYTYAQLNELDEDKAYLSALPFLATDAMNETGLYVEQNMRETDSEYALHCSGVNPGQPRASMMYAPALIALNCSTVAEAWEFLQHSYDWYSVGMPKVNNTELGGQVLNIALLIGDAQGDYGLFEFGMNGIYYTPYPNGHGNYYIHPDLAQYAVKGSGYGRLAAALSDLQYCETEWDMLHNMESAMYKNELLLPGCLGYSDFVYDVNERREMTTEEMQEKADTKMGAYYDMALEYYEGNEQSLRDTGSVWTTGFNFGVNCSAKHLILRLWEKDSTIIEYQW